MRLQLQRKMPERAATYNKEAKYTYIYRQLERYRYIETKWNQPRSDQLAELGQKYIMKLAEIGQ